MPRQLPWLNKDVGNRTQVKQPLKARTKTAARPDDDDGFFDGTVLASSSKGKEKASRNEDDSDDDLPDMTASPGTKHAFRKNRAPSSSPPPIQDYVEPQVENMHTATSEFDLRDDEWMMVEDEFLETAKLFTRHLHIAEYQKLKDRIEAKKKAQVRAARPVVVGGRMSAEGTMKKKAEVQEKRQRKAIQELFAPDSDQEHDEDEDDAAVSHPVVRKATQPSTRRAATSTLSRPPSIPSAYDIDSDDLDASRPASRRMTASKPPSASASTSEYATGHYSISRSAQHSSTHAKEFSKPAVPTARTLKSARRSRATPFDMLDDYKPPTRSPVAEDGRETLSSIPSRSNQSATNTRTLDTPVRPSMSPKPAATATGDKTVDVGDVWGSASGGLSKATADRIAKRKAEREKERERKKKDAKLDDIPTFLV